MICLDLHFGAFPEENVIQRMNICLAREETICIAVIPGARPRQKRKNLSMY